MRRVNALQKFRSWNSSQINELYAREYEKRYQIMRMRKNEISITHVRSRFDRGPTNLFLPGFFSQCNMEKLATPVTSSDTSATTYSTTCTCDIARMYISDASARTRGDVIRTAPLHRGTCTKFLRRNSISRHISAKREPVHTHTHARGTYTGACQALKAHDALKRKGLTGSEHCPPG